MDPVEGVDYIFDRYAFLGLTPDASKDEIHATARQRLAENHPDKMIRLGAEIQRAADRTRNLVKDCTTILLNDALRPLYDERLAKFKAEKPEFVSTNGTAIISLSGGRFDLNSLLEDGNDNFERMAEQAKAISGYVEGHTELIAKLYKADPKNTDLRNTYRDQLGSKLTYLSLLESVAWICAGYTGAETTKGHVLYPDEYAQAAQLAITYTRDEVIINSVDQRRTAVAIGIAQPPLLLTYDNPDKPVDEPAPPTVMSEEVTNNIIAKAQENFDVRAEHIRDIARQKQATLEELLPLSVTHVFNRPAKLSDGMRHVYLFKADEQAEPALMATFEMVRQGDAFKMVGCTLPEGDAPTIAMARAAAPKDIPSIAVIHSSHIPDYFMEVTFAATQLENSPDPKWWQRAVSAIKSRLPGAAP